MTRPRAAAAPMAVIIAAFGVLSGCGSDIGSQAQNPGGESTVDTAVSIDRPSESGGSTGLVVVTTVSPITSIVEAIAGNRIHVVGLVPEGADSHTFEPLPSAARALADADLIVINGLSLEQPILELAQNNKRPGAEVIYLGDSVLSPEDYQFDFSFPRTENRPNPHLWTHPKFVEAYAEVAAGALSSIDPSGSDYYGQKLADLKAQAGLLDSAMRVSFATIPDDNRVLLTYHDAYAYFAQDYGFRVIGAVQPADFGDPSPKDVAALIRQVRKEEVPAIFGSEVFPSPVLDQISIETGGTYVDSLRDDDLPGEPGDEEHSWFGLLRSNYITMTSALGGDASELRSLSLPEQQVSADYPQ